MAFLVRSHQTIRAAILSDWRSRYLALGNDLDTAENSDACALADAVAFAVEGLEAKALQLTRELFPDTCSAAFLERHASVIGLSRKAATAAVLLVTVQGLNGSRWSTSDKLTAADGSVYSPSSAGVLSGTSQANVAVRAATAGTDGNKSNGTLLTWSSAPAGITSTVEVTGVSVAATDEESDEELALRVLGWWKERPGGGNRADWAATAEAYAGVQRAFVYPLLSSTLELGVLGKVTLCVLAEPPTLETDAGEPAASATRFLSIGSAGEEGTLADLAAWLGGADPYTEEGGFVPASMLGDDLFVTSGTPLPQSVSLALTLRSGWSFGWSGTFTLDSGSTAAQLKGTGGAPTGLAAGDWVAVPDTSVRGGYAYRKVASVAWPNVNLEVELDSAPAVGLVVRPLPQNAAGETNAHDIRAAVLALIDALGPGTPAVDSSMSSSAPERQSARWPSDGSTRYPSTLYRSSITAAVVGLPGTALANEGVEGVSSVVVTLTGSSDPEKRVPGLLELVTMGTLLLQ